MDLVSSPIYWLKGYRVASITGGFVYNECNSYRFRRWVMKGKPLFLTFQANAAIFTDSIPFCLPQNHGPATQGYKIHRRWPFLPDDLPDQIRSHE